MRTGKALLHAVAGPDHVLADVAKHLIQDPALAYYLLLCPKHVCLPAHCRPAAAGRPAAGRPPAAASRPPAGRRLAILFMASGQASFPILWPQHVTYILGPNHIVSISRILVMRPSL